MLWIARTLVRRRWWVIALWVIIGVFAFMRAPGTAEKLNPRGGNNRPTQASTVDRILNERFSNSLGEYYVLALQAPTALDVQPGAAVLDSLVAALRAQPHVRGVVAYPTTNDTTFISRDRRTTLVVVALAPLGSDSISKLVKPTRALLRQTLQRAGADSSWHSYVTGRSPLDLDTRALTTEDSRRGELQLLPFTFVILVLAFGALVAALLPILIGVTAIAVSLAVVGVLTQWMSMSIFVLTIATMIGLGVGIDYSLLMVTRFREELGRGLNRRDAAVNTILTAGGAVVTSGLTVVVGFAALLWTPLVETRSVGVGGLIVVAVAVLLAVTLLPAILAVLGKNIDRPRALARRLAWYHSPLIWEKWARSLSRHPWRALTLGTLGVGLLTLPLFWIRIGLPSRHWWPSATESGQAIDVLSTMGVAGYVLPVRMVVEFPEGKTATELTSLRGLRNLSDSLRADPRVREVRSLVDVRRGASLLELSMLYSDLDSARAQLPEFVDAFLSTDARVALLDIIPADTVSLTTGVELVRRARAFAEAPPKQLRGATIRVGGFQASSLDTQEDMLKRFPMLVAIIMAATALMLAIAFRSVLIPLKAILLNTLSVAATFGLIVLVFQKGVGASLIGLDGPTDAIVIVVPVLVFAVVFGLSMDYEVFLLSRIKEAFDRTGRNDEATMEGVSATASVITSAALIMILVFGVFAFARVLAMQFLGFGLAIAVLLDATIIRMVLVPAVMQLMGRWNWWPGVNPREPHRPRVSGSGEHKIE
ncbi:MAG TPA: MMPL family transporter [Gemmatimonadales bacterium]|nr:MMPL family transporter [Gemmatimonadales bacterium]